MSLTVDELTELREHARQTRKYITTMFMHSGHGHFGGSFSCTDIVTALYYHVMQIDPHNPDWPDRDRFIISKGHGSPAVYGTMAQLGYFPEAWIDEYESLGAHLSTHPNMMTIPGFDMSAGSLGHGLPVGVGMALAGKVDGRDYRVFVLMGDGEENEGAIWEAALAANKYHLDHLIGITDRNRLCVGGDTEVVMPMEPLRDKWESFGWETHVTNGHDFAQMLPVMDECRNRSNGKPQMIICNTVKGKGVSFMENVREWHGHAIDDELFTQIMAELNGN